MSYKEKILKCVSCKKEFVFTVEHQESLAAKGYPNEPLRCSPCLRARKGSHASSEDSTPNTPRSGGYLR